MIRGGERQPKVRGCRDLFLEEVGVCSNKTGEQFLVPLELYPPPLDDDFHTLKVLK